MHHVTKQKSPQTGLMNMNKFSVLQWPCQKPDLNPIEPLLGYGRTGALQHEYASVIAAEIAQCKHVNMDQNLKGMFPTSRGINGTKNQGCFEQWEALPSISIVFLIKCSVSVHSYIAAYLKLLYDLSVFYTV